MDILEKIVKHKRITIELQRQKIPLRQIKKSAEEKTHDLDKNRFSSALITGKTSIIAEVKKASPSLGIICKEFDPLSIALQYQQGGAAAISVLTDEKYFKGKLSYLDKISKKVSLPLLRKDFIIDEYQVFEAAINSASAILLIAAILSRQQIQDFIDIARHLKMDALVEIHEKSELENVLQTDAQVIGINNRNLKTFDVTIEKSLELAKYIPENKIKISESGIRTRLDIERLEKSGFSGVLIGETLMKQENPAEFIKILTGEK